MNIEWETRLTGNQDEVATYALIDAPSKIRRGIRHTPSIVGAAYIRTKDGLYKTSFLRPIKFYFDTPNYPLHTERGARRRIRKYLELWAIAGYPTGE